MEYQQTGSSQATSSTQVKPGRGQEQRATARRRRAARPRGLWLFWPALFLWLAILAVIGMGLARSYDLYRSGRILPGVRVWGIDLSGKTTAGAVEVLRSEWQGRELVLDAGYASWTLPLEKLGIYTDPDATARAAYEQLHSLESPQTAWDTARQLLASFAQRNPTAQQFLASINPTLSAPKRIEVPPVWTFDRNVAADTLRMLAQEVEIAPQNAGIRAADGRIETTPAAEGRALDIGATLATLEAQAEQIALAPANAGAAPAGGGKLSLTVVPLEPTVTDVSSVLKQTTQLLANPIPMYLYDPITDERFTWAFTPEEMSSWLSFRVAPDNPAKIEWTVDEAKVADALQAKAAALGDGRYVERHEALPALIDAFKHQGQGSDLRQRLYHYDRTHTVKSDETLSSIAFDYGIPYPWIQAANPGIGDSLRVGQKLTIPSQDNLVPLPPVENKRIKVSLSQQKMQALENGTVKWEWPVSTGLSWSPTNPGVFQVQTHEPNAYAANWDLWMPNFLGIYRPVPAQEFMNGFHGFPSRDRKQLLWTRNLGRPVTYGCILLSTDNSRLLYDWAEEGVVVEITR